MDIEWREPPERALRQGYSHGRYAEFADALRKHPEKWAVLPHYGTADRTEKGARATAQNIRRGKVKGFGRGEFEAVVDEVTVFVRFKPTTSAERKPSSTSQKRDSDNLSAAVREWAQSNGVQVAQAGRIPRDVYERWSKATGNPLPPGPRAVEG